MIASERADMIVVAVRVSHRLQMLRPEAVAGPAETVVNVVWLNAVDGDAAALKLGYTNPSDLYTTILYS